MGELLSQLWSPEMQMALTGVVVLLVVLYVLSIVWVVRDAYMRGVTWWVWGIVALVPILGIIAYCMLRPPMMKIDRDEQNLEVELKKRQLMHYGECATCGYPVEADYVLCPNCHTQLKNMCARCKKALEPMWTVCPFCATPVSGGGRQQRSKASGGSRAARASQSTQRSASSSSARSGSSSASRGGATTAMPRSSSRSTEERASRS